MIDPNVNPGAVVRAVTETWTRLKQERVDKETIWEECWLAYCSKFGKGYAEVSQFKSRRYLPWSFKAIENGTAQAIQGVMPHDDWFKLLGRTPDDEKGAKVMTALMKWQHYRSKFKQKAALVIKQARIFGQAPWAINWKQDYIYKPDLYQHAANMAAYMVDKQSGMEAQSPQVPMQVHRNYDGPCLEVGNIFNFVQERHHLDIGYPLRIVRMTCSKAYLEQESIPNSFGWQKYENVDQIQDQNTQNERSDTLIRGVEQLLGINDIPVDGVELLIAMGDIPLKGDGENQTLRNQVVVVANRRTLLRCEPNPYAHGKCPWNMFVLVEDPIEMYGKGDLESALGLQDIANVTVNQVIEAAHRIINPEFVGVQDGVFDADEFISRPGAVHLVAGTAQNLQVLHKPDNTNIGFNSLQYLSGEFNEAANAMTHVSPGDDPSATLTARIARNEDARTGAMIQHIYENFLIPALQMEVDLNQQFMDEETWIRVIEPAQEPAVDPLSGQPLPYPKYESLGPAPMKIQPEDIQGDMDVYPVGSDWIANQQQQVQQMAQIGQMAGAIPPAAAVIDWAEYIRVCAEKMGIRDTDRFIKSPQRVAYEQYQQQLAAQAQQAQQQQGGPGGSSSTSGNRGVASVAGKSDGPKPPPNPGGQSSMGGPQTTG